MKRKTLKKLLLMLLTFSLITSIMGMSADLDKFSKNLLNRELNFDENLSLLPEDIPEAIDLNVIAQSDHIARQRKLETGLDTIAFLNNDDTTSLYIFDEPVKYVAKDGIIRDKSSKLYDSLDINYDVKGYKKYAYANLDNDIRTFFPRELSEDLGVALVTDDYTIELLPITKETSNADRDSEDEDFVLYDGVFGKNTGLRYTTLFNGFKEDIVLDKNVGNEFSFVLKINGLLAEKDGMAISLIDPLTKDVVANVSPIYVYDSFVGEIKNGEIHETYNNDMILKQRKDGDYELTIIVDKEFLNSPDTVYPVYVDPTITIDTSVNWTGKAIHDLPIYSGSAVSGVSMGSETTAILGYLNSSYGVGRMLMRFPGIIDHPLLNNISQQNILYVNLYLREMSCNSDYTYIMAEYYTGAATWNEYSTNGSINQNAIGSWINDTTVNSSTPTTIGISITEAFNAWRSSGVNSDQAKRGLILRNFDENNYSYAKHIYTTKGATKPYVTVSYKTSSVDPLIFQNAHTITTNSSVYVDITAAYQNRYYTFTPATIGFYTFQSSGNGYSDPYGWLYNNRGELLTFNDDGGGSNNFRIVYHLDAGREYFIAAGLYSSEPYGSYQLTATQTSNLDNVSAAFSPTAISAPSGRSVNINVSRQRQYYSFTAPSAGLYVFETLYYDEACPKGWLYNTAGNTIGTFAINTGGGFVVSANLSANQKVYFVVGDDGDNYGTGIWLSLTKKDGFSSIPISVNYNVDVSIQQAYESQYFHFTPTTTGFYTIESFNNGTSDPWVSLGDPNLAFNNDISPTNKNFRIVYHLEANQNYYIQVGCNGIGTGNFQFSVTPTISLDTVSVSFSHTAISMSSNSSVSIYESYWRKYFSFTAPTTGTYVFQSVMNGSSNPYGWLYNADGILLDSDDNGSGNNNFQITRTLTAGQKVYLVAGCFGNGEGNYSVIVKGENTTFANSDTITINEYRNVNVTVSNQKRYFDFIPTITGFYAIESSGNNTNTTDPYGWVYHNSNQVDHLAINDDGAGNLNFRIVYHLEAGQKYFIASGCHSSKPTGSYQLKITSTVALNSVSNSTSAALTAPITLSTSTTGAASISTAYRRQYFSFTAPTAGDYTLSISGNSNPFGWLYNSNGVLMTNYIISTSSNHYSMTVNLTANEKIFLIAGCSGIGIGNFAVNVVLENTAFANAYTVSANVNTNVSVTAPNQKRYYSFTAPTAGDYIFQSFGNGTSNPIGRIYSSGNSLLDSNDDIAGVDNRNFRMMVTLTSGQTVYLAAGCSNGSIGDFSVNVSSMGLVDGGTYYIKNFDTGKYMEDNKGGNVRQNPKRTLNADIPHQRWRVIHSSNGKYWIQPLNGSYNVTNNHPQYALTSNSSGGLSVTGRNSSFGDGQLFLLTQNNDGSYYIQPAIANNYSLRVANSNDGTTITTAVHSDSNANMKWQFEIIGNDFSMIMDNYFDGGWSARSGSDSVAISRISEAQDLINSTMLSSFNLTITSNTPEKFTSTSDECLGDSEFNRQCPHLSTGQICSYGSTSHHKIRANISQIYPPGSSNTDTSKIVTWTGHVTCAGGCDGNSHFNTNGGIASRGGKRSHIYPAQYWSTTEQRFEIAFHEQSHLMGAAGDTNHGMCITGSTVGDGSRSDGDIYRMIVQFGDTNVHCSICTTQITEHLLSRY